MKRKNITRILLAVTCLLIGSYHTSSLAVTLEKTLEVTDLSMPESVIYDVQRDRLYVSNVNGGESGTETGKGFLSKIALDGTIETLQWITELNGPKEGWTRLRSFVTNS